VNKLKNKKFDVTLSQKKIDTLSKSVELAKNNIEINTLVEEFVANILNSEYSSLWFYDKQELRLIREEKNLQNRELSLDLKESIIYKCFMSKTSGIYNYIASEKEYVASIDNPDKIKIKSKIIFPLMDNDELVGIITAYTSIKKIKKFTEKDIKILETISPLLINTLYKMHTSHAKKIIQPSIEDGNFVERKSENKKYKQNFDNTIHMMANFVHDIRTPANTLYGFLELLEDQISDKRLKEYLQNAKESAGFINELTTTMLDKIKLDKESQESSVVDVETVGFFSKITDMFMSNMYSKQIGFNIYIDPLLPKKIAVDELKLKRTIMNLLSNAYKFTPYGKNIEFSLKYNSDKKSVSISIKDEGIGIPREKQDEIFEAFKQVDDSISQTYGGTGLGLFICAEYVRDLGGKLQLNSEIEKGTTFYFDIPIQIIQDEKCFETISNNNLKIAVLMNAKNKFCLMNIAKYIIGMGGKKDNIIAVSSLSEVPKDTTNLIIFQSKIDKETMSLINEKSMKVLIVEEEFLSIEKNDMPDEWDIITQNGYFASELYKFINIKKVPKVLIVDDDKTSVMLIEKILENEYCKLEVALNGKIALEMLIDSHKKQAPYSVVFIDNKMPLMNGIEVMRNLREFEQDNGLSAIFAVSTTGDALDLKTQGKDFNLYVGKPFKVSEIRKALNH